MNRKQTSATVVIFLLCAAVIAVLAFNPFGIGLPLDENQEQKPGQFRTRVIVPEVMGNPDMDPSSPEYMAYQEGYDLKAPLNDGELVISVLNLDFDNDSIDEQLVAFRNLNDAENPVAIAFFAYSEDTNRYRRMWDAPTAAAMPGTVSMYTQDLLGDRSICIIVTGMTAQSEHTMTIFYHDPNADRFEPFRKIAEIQMDGSITIQETDRPLAYRQGIARGQPFTIITHKSDSESENMLDRIEITYAFNNTRGIYEQSAINRIPGSQIEQRRLREILSGRTGVFEEFINDLWYHVSAEGTVDNNQYLYFDPEKHEIIFFGDDTQQIFIWQTSNSFRYGLLVACQNISITTLRRFITIEMESLDSIRLKVTEDVRLKINVPASWDGLYRRAGAVMRGVTEEIRVRPYTDAVYDSSMGRLRFAANGEYELSSGGVVTKGRYAFFQIGSQELLELRPERNSLLNGDPGGNGENRFIYSIADAGGGNDENLSLTRVRLGASGIYELHEGQIILTRAQ